MTLIATELDQALAQMQRLDAVISGLREEVLPNDPHLFALLAEGPLFQIRQLQQQIEEYVGELSAPLT